MRYLLDTNVISEPTRPRPNPAVEAWIAERSPQDLAVSVLSLGEIAQGLRLLPDSQRKDRFADWLARDLPARFEGRVVAVDAEVALEWGRVAAESRREGRALSTIDGLILATASVHRLTLVTRNTRDLENRGVPVVNPWSA